MAALHEAGWRVLVIWECETKKLDVLEQTLLDFMTDATSPIG